MKFPKFSNKDWSGWAVIVCIGVTLFVLLSNISSVIAVLAKVIGYFRPVILGVIIAYIISPLAKLFFYRAFRRIRHRKLRWYLSVFLSFALLMLAFFLLGGMLLPQLIRSIVMFSQNFDNYAQSFTRLIVNSPLITIIDEQNIELLYQNAMSAIADLVKETENNTLSIAASAGKHIISSVIALILAVYLLLDVRNVLIGVRKFAFKVLPENTSMVFMDFVLRCDTILVTYIAQSFMDALIIGSVNAIFMAICKMPYIGLISVVVGVTNLIPNFGPAIGAVIGAFILLMAGPGNTVAFLVFCLLLQSVDAYILKPKLFSSALGVSGVSILISTIVLGNMFGILGVLLAIPVAAIVSFAYHEYFMKSVCEEKMIPIIDMHCDTISKIYELRRKGEAVRLRRNNLHLDLMRMKEAGYMAQCFALFTYMPYTQERGVDPAEYAKALSDTMDRELEANADLIRPALSAADIARNYQEGLLSAVKTIEEGAVYKGSPEMVRFFYDLGVRKSTLTWNFENELAFPNRAVRDAVSGEYHVFPETERGLKKAGQDAVQLMEELGMLIDVSHLGDAGILEILDMVGPHTPVIASHSNARAVTGHPRNLTDQMLRGIAEHGGVTGINFCAAFLTEDGNGVSRIRDMVRHVRYIYNVAGCDAIGLGTDFDGIDDQLEINGAGEMQRLADALSAAGFTSGEIEKIFWRNVMRVYEDVLG